MRRPTPTLEVDVSSTTTTRDSLDTPPSYQISQELQSRSHSPVHFAPVDFKKSLDSPTSSVDVVPPPHKPTAPTPSIRLLFSLISRRQFFFLLLPAIISSITAGGIAPFMTYVIGQSFEAFARFPLSDPSSSAKSTLLHGVGIAALELVGLAVGALALSSVTSCLWIWTGEYNAMVISKRVYAAVTGKDMVWFDLKMGAEGGVTSLDDNEDGPMGAGGLMAKFAR